MDRELWKQTDRLGPLCAIRLVTFVSFLLYFRPIGLPLFTYPRFAITTWQNCIRDDGFGPCCHIGRHHAGRNYKFTPEEIVGRIFISSCYFGGNFDIASVSLCRLIFSNSLFISFGRIFAKLFFLFSWPFFVLWRGIIFFFFRKWIKVLRFLFSGKARVNCWFSSNHFFY